MEDETEVEATKAASPRALAVAPSVVPTSAQALDASELPRMRVFGMFGVGAACVASALAVLIGGDPLAREVFWAGIGMLGLCNVWLIWLCGSAARYTPTAVAGIWVISSFGVLPALYYFGPFSAVVIAPMLGVVFIAMGKNRGISRAVTAILIGGHGALAIPIIFGWIRDRGVLPSLATTQLQLFVAEGLILAFLISSYLLGRWARTTNKAALDELARAMRVIGDQQQQLAEVDEEAAAARRAKEGRWTHHMMGGYRLGLLLGRGAMGEVYEAHDRDDNPAAVKLLNARGDSSDSLVERFHREMSVAARLESPHIVRVLSLSPADAPVPFLAMERLVGTDLAAILRTQQRLPIEELVPLVAQVARGLEVARAAGVVHRDLKPHNLFKNSDGTWKILDFGVSKLMDSEGTLTGDGIVGTPQYMAPEQASGGRVTHLADVYALGAIAYRCLTARAPFKGKDLAELVYQVVHVAPPRPSTLGRVSPQVEAVLDVAMAKDPSQRYPTAIAFAEALVTASSI